MQLGLQFYFLALLNKPGREEARQRDDDVVRWVLLELTSLGQLGSRRLVSGVVQVRDLRSRRRST
jgi:hypothetical protein